MASTERPVSEWLQTITTDAAELASIEATFREKLDALCATVTTARSQGVTLTNAANAWGCSKSSLSAKLGAWEARTANHQTTS